MTHLAVHRHIISHAASQCTRSWRLASTLRNELSPTYHAAINKYCLGHTSAAQIRSTDWFNENNDHQFVTCSLCIRSTLACSHPISAETISTDSNVIYRFLDCSSASDYYHRINKNLIADDYSI